MAWVFYALAQAAEGGEAPGWLVSVEIIGVVLAAVLGAAGWLIARAWNRVAAELRELRKAVGGLQDRMTEHEVTTAEAKVALTHLADDHVALTDRLTSFETRFIDHLTKE